ncbi:MAG: hypothetical protein V4487_03740, partial [Chlamydiota bacterium]
MIMISTIQSYQFNNKVAHVDLTKVQELSDSTKNILTNLGAHLPQSFRTMDPLIHQVHLKEETKKQNFCSKITSSFSCGDPIYAVGMDAPLVERIHSMEETAQLLKETKENSTRDKVIAFLKTAAVVVLVVGIIMACIFGGKIGIALGCVLGIISYLMLTVWFYCSATENIANIEKRLPDYKRPWYNPDMHPHDLRAFFPPLGGALVLPLFEAYTRESRLTRILKEQQEGIAATFSEYQEENNRILPNAYQFYKNESQKWIDQLNYKIEQSQKSLFDIEQVPERSVAGENDLKGRIAAFQKAIDDLKGVIGFYRQFDAS